MLAACWRRKSHQLGPERRGAGVSPAASSSRRKVLGETRRPSLSSSPAIRGYPQRGFSRAKRRTSSRTRRSTGGRPGRSCGCAHFRRTRSRCQRSSVSGVTISPAGVETEGAGSAPQEEPDRLAEATAVAAGDRARQADAAERAVRCPWRTRYAGLRQAGAAPPKREISEGEEHPPMLPEPATVEAESSNRGVETPHPSRET